MSDINYRNWLLRRLYCRRLWIFFIVFAIGYFGTLLIFGDLRTPQVMRLTDLKRCPACYGVSMCPELYSNQIYLESHSWSSIFNAKNIFHAYTKSNRKVILKKLAHDSELREFDRKLCKSLNLNINCKPIDLLNITNIVEKNIINLAKYDPSWSNTEAHKGLVVCPHAESIHNFIEPVVSKKGSKTYASDIANAWTMLSLNPEPIVLQVIPKSKGWPVPAYGGVCGRLEVVANEGESLSSLTNVAWIRKLKFAKKIIDAAMDFTFKHDRYRFYLMDWSLDNIVANDKDDISFIDLEDIVILDKHTWPKSDLPDWFKTYRREQLGPGFSFSIESLCKYHLSDHNVWAACYVLAGDDNPLLHPIPEAVNNSRPSFEKLLDSCLNGGDRFYIITQIQHTMTSMLKTAYYDGLAAARIQASQSEIGLL